MSVETGPHFVDTNILVYAHDRDAGIRHEAAYRLMSRLWDSDTGILSTQVLQEFYVTVTRKIPSPVSPASARALIEPYTSWHVETAEPVDVLRASEIQERHRLSFWDALIVAVADKAGAKIIYSEDLNAGQQIEGMKIVNPLND
ncbi:PIN domain-containing protein [Gammaproteobacteria bacterium AB-CW1]|uniref:PIN domain-containing protein n=1 Tax=Natronospira elongata TaxID=3110268 RepID=A0AAP6ML41_9GAMM|nr:PIN domain-containing protein [Gammaproteobacteria bacterium AB-CW1]